MMTREQLRRARGYLELHGRLSAIWVALALLFAVSAVIAPASVRSTSLSDILPFAAILAMAAIGEVIVVMTGGIDLSVPSVITMASITTVGISQGSDVRLGGAIFISLLLAAGVGFVNGVLVAVLRLNPLVVTLSIGTIVTGGTIWYHEGILQESGVPNALASWAGHKPLGLNVVVWMVLGLAVLLTVAVRGTVIGRRFVATGANARAAWIAGIPVMRYQIGAYAIAGLLYGCAGILLAAFIRTPNLDVGAPYLLGPIAAVVLGGALLSGGVASIPATVGGALFLTQLDQVLRVLGLSSALQYVVSGSAIAFGMALSAGRLGVVPRALRPWSALRQLFASRRLMQQLRDGVVRSP